LTLKLNRPGLYPRAALSGRPANQDLGEGAGVRGGVAARGAADWALVDLDHLVAQFKAGDLVVRAGDDPRAVERARGAGVKRVERERGLAAAR
jgi:hypothetical protein